MNKSILFTKTKWLEADFQYSLIGHWNILSVSDSIAELLGYDANSFINEKLKLKSLIHNDDRDISDILFSSKNIPKFNQADIQNFNLRMRRKDGSIICLKAICKKEFISPEIGPTMHLLLQDGKSLWKKQGHGDFTTEFKSMMENTNDYIYFKDRNHVFTGASQTLVSLTDPSEHWTDLLGKTDYDVFPEEYADHYYSLEKQVFAGIPVAHRIQETLDNDGNKGWVDNRKYPIFGENKQIIGLFGIARDITESKEAQESLKLSQKELLEANKKNEQILNATGEGIYGLDLNGRTTFANPAAEKMLGFSFEEMREKSQHDLVHHTKADGSRNPSENCKIYKTFKTGNVGHADDELFWRKDGTSFPVEYITNPIIEKGEIKGAVVSFKDISKRLEAEESLTLSENQFRTVFEKSPFGIALIDALTGLIFESNPRFDEISGRNLFPHQTLNWFNVTHPDDLKEEQDQLADLNAGKIKSYSFIKRYIKPDGSLGWINKTVIPITVPGKKRPSNLIMVEDITENKKFEEKIRNYQIHLEDEIHNRTLELKNSLLRFKSYFELPLIGVAITSPQKGWMNVNQKLCDLLGYREKELFNMTWDQLTHPEDLSADVKLFNKVLSGEIEGYSLNKRFMRKDNAVIYTDSSFRCVRKSNGDIDYFVALINDITERIQAEKKVKETQEQLIHSEKLSTLGRFAASVAHEFNNPLFGLISLVEQLGDQLEDKERKNFSKLAQKECWRMVGMIKNLQSFNQPSEEIFTSVSINTLIEETLLIAGKALQEKGIEVKKDYTKHTYAFDAIEDQIKQVILNVIQNAIDSIKPNNNGKITLTLAQSIDDFVFKIKDTGKGIKKENMKMIFDPFFTTKGNEGTGLGLSVSYGIIKKHGGDITIKSQLNTGTTVTIVLPTKRDIK